MKLQTSNVNKCLHSLVWRRAPNAKYCGKKPIEIAVALAIFGLSSMFLSSHKQRVEIGNSYSSYAEVSSRVPQGSCTCPLNIVHSIGT